MMVTSLLREKIINSLTGRRNLAIDANKHIVQETNGAFIKGFGAIMNADGTTTQLILRAL